MALHRIHARVGRTDDGMHLDAVVGRGGQATLALTFSFSPFFMRNCVSSGRDAWSSPARERYGIGLRHQDHELVAAVAKAQICLRLQLLKPLSGQRQQFAADKCPCASFTSLNDPGQERQAYGNRVFFERRNSRSSTLYKWRTLCRLGCRR